MANLIPLAGVAFWGWSVRNLLLLYWAENVIVGFWAVARMVRVNPLAGLPMGVFFCVHFGMFCFVHLAFVNVLTHPGGLHGADFMPSLSEIIETATPWALLALFVSHGLSFALNFLRGGEWRRSQVQLEMMKPYPRMVVLHIAIIFGGWLTMLFGAPAGVLVILVLLKIGLDLGIHAIGHKIRAREPEA